MWPGSHLNVRAGAGRRPVVEVRNVNPRPAAGRPTRRRWQTDGSLSGASRGITLLRRCRAGLEDPGLPQLRGNQTRSSGFCRHGPRCWPPESRPSRHSSTQTSGAGFYAMGDDGGDNAIGCRGKCWPFFSHPVPEAFLGNRATPSSRNRPNKMASLKRGRNRSDPTGDSEEKTVRAHGRLTSLRDSQTSQKQRIALL